jgi:hypothetical protein
MGLAGLTSVRTSIEINSAGRVAMSYRDAHMANDQKLFDYVGWDS